MYFIEGVCCFYMPSPEKLGRGANVAFDSKENLGRLVNLVNLGKLVKLVNLGRLVFKLLNSLNSLNSQNSLFPPSLYSHTVHLLFETTLTKKLFG